MASNFIKKESLAQVFSSEFCEFSKNTFFYRTTPGDCFWICKIFCNIFSLKQNFNIFSNKTLLITTVYNKTLLWIEKKIIVLIMYKSRSSQRRCSARKGVLRNFVKFPRIPFLQNTSGRLTASVNLLTLIRLNFSKEIFSVGVFNFSPPLYFKKN